MHKRFYGQRQHIIYSLDTLLYQLHTLSFFLSPSIWIYACRVLSQFQYSKPRELDPTRSLRFFYIMVLLFNLPSLWYHSIHETVEGRIIILDFIGMSYNPSKIQLCLLDLSIITLQLLLTTIAYETSVYYANDDADPQDTLLPEVPPQLSIPLFQGPESPLESPSGSSTMSSTKAISPSVYHIPLVIDLHFEPIMAHLRNPPPPPRMASASVLPVPNTTAWPLPGMRMIMRARRQMRATAGVRAPPSTEVTPRPGRVPGELEPDLE